ncbi:hypothetical protein EMPS_04892 [Entomortierella parvispora]|uniref:Uncharacterized protein n=1 Tax=Entomortierella parvispora TaxID=205924 RepID=A0A9P3LW00_9FUNG|nr:hypothetical protein EMPS_04892 [Entomortierella parvispora]
MKFSATSTIIALAMICTLTTVTECAPLAAFEVEAQAPPAPTPTSHCKGGPVHDKRGYECPMDEVVAQAPAAPNPTSHCQGGPIHIKRGYECPM